MITQGFFSSSLLLRSSSAFLFLFFFSPGRIAEERLARRYCSSLLKRILRWNQIKMLFISHLCRCCCCRCCRCCLGTGFTRRYAQTNKQTNKHTFAYTQIDRYNKTTTTKTYAEQKHTDTCSSRPSRKNVKRAHTLYDVIKQTHRSIKQYYIYALKHSM